MELMDSDIVPWSMLIMIIVKCVTLVLDRAFYTKRYLTGKFLLNTANIILVNFWIIAIMPFISKEINKFEDKSLFTL